MQAALLALSEFWAARGCAVVQPYNTEVGAGTMNPATFLRVLGPEPWSVGYVEPSVRPDDSRYGDNPNRLQTHTQYQVILKPEPGNPQELYLESLVRLGIDVAAHDIRFVEDNWESPALGAWGLGWEVWLDGQEITQFTYFQQAGGIVLDPPATEITYGMERILMALHGIDHFRDIPYADGVTYGELFAQSEYEWSTFYLDAADVELLRRQLSELEAEAGRLIGLGLPIPAYAHILRCSHTFNVLDARGAMGTTERATAFASMRRLAHDVAELWRATREETGFPLGRADVADAAPTIGPPPAVGTEARTFLLELGVEELPAADVASARALLASATAEALAGTDLGHGDVTVVGTPRRLIVTVADVDPVEPERTVVVRGPKVKAAFDADGGPTKAAEGFARSRGTTVDALTRVTEKGEEHLAFETTGGGRTATEVLAELVPAVLGRLRFGKNMRWRPGSDLAFSRPVRWLVALLGDEVVPTSWAGLAAGRDTRLFRSTGDPTATLTSAETALATLAEHGLVPDPIARREQITTVATALAEAEAGTVDVERWAALVDEVVDLVEAPTPVLGSFDPIHLDLPPEVLTAVMSKHQRYLPVTAADGALLPHFVTVANASCDPDVVRRGNEAVISARYADAAFFVARDRETPVADLAAGLASITFDSRLGSVRDRVDRIAATGVDLARAVDADPAVVGVVEEAGPLAKFDQASQMVMEMTSLAGTMARYYGRDAGLSSAVVTAVAETELPRAAGDEVPGTLPGALLSLADRLDLLTALFAVGAEPTGSADPYGLRRAARGVVLVAMSGVDPALDRLSIRGALAAAATHLPVDVPDDLVERIEPFVRRRFEQTLLDQGHRHDLVQAALALHHDVPARVRAALTDLEAAVGSERFGLVADALKRADRLVGATDRATLPTVDPGLFDDPTEGALLAELERVEAADADRSVAGYLAAAEPMAVALNDCLDTVMVMADDPAVRANRLALVARVAATGAGVVDWTAIE